MGNDNFPLAMPQTTLPLTYGDLLHRRHHMLTHHLPGLDLALQRVQGSLIATHIGEVVVELRQDRESKALACKADNNKGSRTCYCPTSPNSSALGMWPYINTSPPYGSIYPATQSVNT